MTANWSRFYDVAGGTPRETLVFALDRFETEPRESTRLFGVDLGCGAGRDTAEMLRRGWRVLAIDGEPEAIERLRRRGDLDAAAEDRLTTQVARFADTRWPVADLVNSSFALPFASPSEFPAVWRRIVASLRPGGRFSGQLFGDRDGWAAEPDMSFHSRREAEHLLGDFDVERFDEVEEDGKTAIGDAKHWHVFHVVARKH